MTAIVIVQPALTSTMIQMKTKQAVQSVTTTVNSVGKDLNSIV